MPNMTPDALQSLRDALLTEASTLAADLAFGDPNSPTVPAEREPDDHAAGSRSIASLTSAARDLTEIIAQQPNEEAGQPVVAFSELPTFVWQALNDSGAFSTLEADHVMRALTRALGGEEPPVVDGGDFELPDELTGPGGEVSPDA